MFRVRKLCVVGFPAVGKTSLITQLSTHKFYGGYVPTTEENSEIKFNIGNREYALHLFDTSGVSELPVFPHNYCAMDGWVLVFSVHQRRSFEVLESIWKTLYDISGKVKLPLVIVGNKIDQPGPREVAPEEAKELAKTLGGVYLEASAKDFDSTYAVFRTVVSEIDKGVDLPEQPKEKGCTIL